MRRWLPYLGIALGIALVAYALFFVKSDEERIRERLSELASTVEVKDRRETPLIRSARVRKSFASLFSKEVRLAVPELGTVDHGREPLVSLTVSALGEFTSVTLDLGELSIRLDESKAHGLAVGTAKLSATRGDGTLSRDTRVVSLRLDRQQDAWQIVDVSVSPPADSADSEEGVAPLKSPSGE